jgi:hypothetical protein
MNERLDPTSCLALPQPPVDDTAPHEDFVLASPINRIVATDLDEMLGAAADARPTATVV